MMRLVPMLQRADWPLRREVEWRSLTPWLQLPHTPIVSFASEREGGRYEFLRSAGRISLDAIETEAVATLRQQPVKWKELAAVGGFLGMGKHPTALTLKDDFAAERILDPELMRDAHRRLRSPLLAAVIPTRGVLYLRPVRSLEADADALEAMVRWNNLDYQSAPTDRQPLTPLVFTIENGHVSGVIPRRLRRAHHSGLGAVTPTPA